jgi:hypothetical protein
MSKSKANTHTVTIAVTHHTQFATSIVCNLFPTAVNAGLMARELSEVSSVQRTDGTGQKP